MTGIFISYRRSATGATADRLANNLRRHFGHGQVFFDLRSLKLGQPFDGQIERTLARCSIAVVLIGESSFTRSTSLQPLETDFFLLEVQRLLEREIPVIPVLVDGAQMPGEANLPSSVSALVKNQAFEITTARWHYDVKSLIARIEELTGGSWKKATSAGAGVATGIAGSFLTNVFVASKIAIPIAAVGIAQPLVLGGAAIGAGYAGFKFTRKLLHKL